MYICVVANCNKEISGKKSSNLTAHLRAQHNFFFEKHVGTAPKKQDLPMPAMRLKFIQACAEIITVDGRTFTTLAGDGFMRLTEDNLNDLIGAGYGSGLSAPHFRAVKMHIKYLAGRIFDEIRASVENTFVSVMVDAATSYDKSILGINLQYIAEGQHILRCIGMVNLTEGHSADYLMEEIFKRLNAFGIEPSHIISVTTDNAPNMLATVALMSEYCQSIENCEDISGNNSDDESDGEDTSNAISTANNVELFE